MSRKLVLVTVALLAAMAMAGCGSSNKVGNNSLVNFKDQTQQRLGATTSTTGGPATTAAGGGGHLGIGGTPTTAAPRVATTQPPVQQQSFEIDINGDNSGTTQFDPSAARVFVGTTVKFVNKDTVARGVESDTGAFVSGTIAPGASWSYKAASAGQFNYHDSTRPYAVGSLEVVGK
jgi:plastocyanin